MDSKKDLRACIRALNRAFTPSERAEQSEILCGKVLQESHYRAARCVALFCSLPDEADTSALIAAAARTKIVVLPVVDGNDMYFREAPSQSEMRCGAFGIMEPTGRICPPEAIDFILVPGMAFDAAGNRMGRGRGYYDRYLARCRAFKAGICLSYQFVASVPHEEHDITMDIVIRP